MKLVKTTTKPFGIIANVSALISLLLCFSQSDIAFLKSYLKTSAWHN